MWGRASAALGLVFCVAGGAAGQAVGPEFRVNTVTTGGQGRSAVAADDDGNFVVVWDSADVFAQRFDRLGRPRGVEFPVNTYVASTQRFAAVDCDASGAFVIVWQSLGQDGSATGIFARRFDSAGTPQGLSEFRVNAYTTSEQQRPRVAVTAEGGFVVVWDSYGQDGSSRGVFGRQFEAGGGAGPEFQINTYTTSAQYRPAVAATPDGGFVVAWASYQDGSDSAVLARRYDSSGTPLGPEFQVSTVTTGYQGYPDVAVDGDGRFVIVWGEVNGADTSNAGIAGRRFDATGAPLGAPFAVNTYTTGIQFDATVAVDPTGAFVVAWNSYDGSSGGVSGQRFDASGARIGSEFRVNTYTTNGQVNPTVASLGRERFVVTWDSALQDGSSSGVFAQRYGDLIFRDGFETGDTSLWSATADDGGDLEVTIDAAMKSTTSGLQAFADDTNGLYVQDDTPKDETSYHARFYFHPGDFDPGETLDHRRTRLFIGFEEAPPRRLFAVVLRRIGGQYSLMGRARRDDNSQANTAFYPITAAQHVVEVRWVRADPGGNNGVFELWLDGGLRESIEDLDNDISTVDFARMGALSVKTGAAGTLYFDEFESRRETLIGP